MVETAILSSKGKVTIPLFVREKLGLKPGDRIIFMDWENGAVCIMNAAAFVLAETPDSSRTIIKAKEKILRGIQSIERGDVSPEEEVFNEAKSIIK